MLVRVINRGSITDVPRFAEILSEFVRPDDIFILTDNDPDDETELLIQRLGLNNSNKIKVGHKEFEDAFEPDVVYESWKRFVQDNERTVGEAWTIDNIRSLRDKCITSGEKFSEQLRELNRGCLLPLKKITLAQALAEYCLMEHLPKPIYNLLQKL